MIDIYIVNMRATYLVGSGGVEAVPQEGGGEGGRVRGRGEGGLLPVEVPGGREVVPAQFAPRPVNIT